MAQRWHSLLLAACVLLVTQAVYAQETNNGQGKILWAVGKWLSGSDSAAPLAGMGWTDGGNPCSGWGGVSCNSEGYVTSINLAGKGLTGSIPSDPGLWAGLTGLTNIDLANNQLSGSVPAAIKSAPLLSNANLADNRGLCGYLPTGLAASTGGTGIGIECGAAASPSPSPSPPSPPPPSPSPLPAAASPAVPSNTSTAAASPAPATSPATAPPQVPAAPPTEISSAPICSCALRGFGSQDCTGALAKECRVADPPAVCANRTTVLNDTEAATALGQYLADACFKGQNMDTSICTCVQNLLGNDCAKARVSLCVKGDPLCLPLQNILGDSGSAAAGNASADAAQQVATALNAQCAVAEPNQAGVKATMEFPDLSMGQYISKQYTQNVANALSSVTNVPTSSISTLDVRPFTGAARPAPPKRLLLQAAGNGVQATYFLGTEDPMGVSQRLSTAANDGTLSSRLAQYGITAQAGGLRVQNYLQPAAPASEGGSSFPLWALAPIIVGSLLLIGAGVLCFCCLRKKRRGQKAEAYAPTAAAGKQQAPVKKVPSGRTNNDLGPARDMPGKGYDGPPTGYVAAGAGAVGVGAAAAAGAGYKPASSANYKNATPATSLKSPPSPKAYDTAPAGNGKIAKGPAVGAGVAAGAAAAAAAAAAGGAAAMKRSGSNRAPRPESPTSGKGSGGNLASLGVAGPAAGAAPSLGGPAHLSNLQSMKVRDYEEPIARAGSGSNSTLTPWEAASRSGSSGLQSKAPAGPPPSASGVTGGPLRTGAGPAAGVAAAGAAVGAGAAAVAMSGSRSGSLGPTTSSDGLQGSGSGAWKSNVRPATGQMPNTGGPTGSTMMANPAAKSSQQAERAKFWAQFQETWQQVRQTQNVDNEPGSPSSGTNWTDITDARTLRH